MGDGEACISLTAPISRGNAVAFTQQIAAKNANKGSFKALQYR
jgi:hypothetical protein